MTDIAISTTEKDGGEYRTALEKAGGTVRLLTFDTPTLDEQIGDCAGIVLSGGSDVNPARYGAKNEHSETPNDARDEFEIALVRRARALGVPTLCICRGLQVANVAFGGTLVQDIGTSFDERTAARHRFMVDGKAKRELIAGHDVAVESGSLLATIVGAPAIVTGSRHHQSVDRVAADLRVVGRAADGIVEAAEAGFPSPFWLAVQWHPESTLHEPDGGASRAIFKAFVAAAERFRAAS
jgi:putative glutamine amidotransferase